MAKLKVFSWSDGFHAFTVATASRPKALEAWGMKQDIFKSGLAREITEGPAYEAALEAPGEVIQKGEAVDKGALARTPKAAKRKGPTQAQKDRVAALEGELERLDEAQARTLAGIDAELARVQARREAEEKTQRTARDALVARLKAARGKL